MSTPLSTALSSEQLRTIEQLTTSEPEARPCSFCDGPSVVTWATVPALGQGIVEISCCDRDDCRDQERELRERFEEDDAREEAERDVDTDTRDAVAGSIPFRPRLATGSEPDGDRPFFAAGELGRCIADADGAITAIEVAGEVFAEAQAEEMRLEDIRPLIKEQAIIRLMAKTKRAATAMEKIVELDDEYMAHRVKQRAAVVDRITKHAALDAAKHRADLATAMVRVHGPA